MATKQLNVTIDESVKKRLSNLAEMTGRKSAFYAAEFIERGLNDYEDYYRVRHALEEFYEEDDGQGIPIEDVDWENLDRY